MLVRASPISSYGETNDHSIHCRAAQLLDSTVNFLAGAKVNITVMVVPRRRSERVWNHALADGDDVEARKKAANLSVVVFLVNHFVEAIDADAGVILVRVTLQTIQGSIRPLLVFYLLS